ncbi:hypothetical protein ABT56_19785 [Photobacterium aquae]|uniref:DUF4136 domain-containing protein n=1 Tax=Photobacterium aquae TaxID=1195763 RepID=A0A0J1JMK9_9GAMM|nr:DUF4136 domain-containing protein [Photobacterium aquae]KLV03367.1 hypothetical protein ABT56_19785 [Photobacterium aquae]
MIRSLFLTTTMMLLLGACSSDVSTDYNTAVNYSQFKTYQFSAGVNHATTTLDGKRMEDAIAVALYQKGMEPAANNADVTVTHSIIEQSDYRSYGTSIGFGYGYRNFAFGYSPPTDYREYRYGKLVVEMIDNSNNQVVWRAVSKRKLSETLSPSARIDFINTQINEMFKQYPPL